METKTIYGVRYKIGDIIEYLDDEFMDKGELCTLLEIKVEGPDIFFRGVMNKTGQKFGGLYAHRFRLYKKNNLNNY